MGAIGQGIANVEGGQVGSGDWANATGGMLMAAPAVVAGAAYATGNAAMGAVGLGTGEGFQDAYRTGFFNTNTFDSAGRREWQNKPAADGGGAGADQQIAEKTDALLKNTGMAGKGSLLLALSKKYSVPMELALSQFAKEAQFNSTGVAPRNNNPGNLRFTGKWGDDKKGEGGFAHFPSIDAGIEGYFMLMSNNYQDQIVEGMKTGDWSSLVEKYAPSTDGNNTKQYADQMNQWTAMYNKKIMPSSRGGWLDVGADDTPALLHKKEMVLPAAIADELRAAIRAPGISASEAKGAGGDLRVRIDPITIQLPGGGTTTVNAVGSYTPFNGVVDHPIGAAS